MDYSMVCLIVFCVFCFIMAVVSFIASKKLKEQSIQNKVKLIKERKEVENAYNNLKSNISIPPNSMVVTYKKVQKTEQVAQADR